MKHPTLPIFLLVLFLGPWLSFSSDEEQLQRVITAMLTMQRKAWEQGTCAQALYEVGEYKLAELMARESVLRQTEEGRLATHIMGSSPTDAAAPGEIVLKFGLKLEDQELIDAAQKCLEFLKIRAPKAYDGTLYHVDRKKEMWIDSMYMAPPFIAAIGDYEFAIQQVEGLHSRLWNSEAQLYHHIWDDEKMEYRVPTFWGVGNGWAMVGLLRTAAHLPDGYSEDKARIVGYFKTVLDSSLSHLRDDGFTHFAFDDPSSFVDTAAPMLIAYSIYRGIQLGWLDSNHYLPFAERIRAACVQKVDENGFVFDACGLPDFESPSRAPECQAFYIMMEAARKDMDTDI
jgi:unsaturated rhamnogalacturonyl hydrolase